jgi:hypothetical protein
MWLEVLTVWCNFDTKVIRSRLLKLSKATIFLSFAHRVLLTMSGVSTLRDSDRIAQWFNGQLFTQSKNSLIVVTRVWRWPCRRTLELWPGGIRPLAEKVFRKNMTSLQHEPGRLPQSSEYIQLFSSSAVAHPMCSNAWFLDLFLIRYMMGWLKLWWSTCLGILDHSRFPRAIKNVALAGT